MTDRCHVLASQDHRFTLVFAHQLVVNSNAVMQRRFDATLVMHSFIAIINSILQDCQRALGWQGRHHALFWQERRVSLFVLQQRLGIDVSSSRLIGPMPWLSQSSMHDGFSLIS